MTCHEDIKIPSCQEVVVHTHLLSNLISKEYLLISLSNEIYLSKFKIDSYILKLPRYYFVIIGFDLM